MWRLKWLLWERPRWRYRVNRAFGRSRAASFLRCWFAVDFTWPEGISFEEYTTRTNEAIAWMREHSLALKREF